MFYVAQLESNKNMANKVCDNILNEDINDTSELEVNDIEYTEEIDETSDGETEED